VSHWEWKNRLPRPAVVSLISPRKVSAQLFTCEFPFHFSRMEKSHYGQTEDSDSG
jgi:hypothetical protein